MLAVEQKPLTKARHVRSIAIFAKLKMQLHGLENVLSIYRFVRNGTHDVIFQLQRQLRK